MRRTRVDTRSCVQMQSRRFKELKMRSNSVLKQRARDSEHKSKIDWSEVKKISFERGFSDMQCPICHEHYAKNILVILSCSHIYHMRCIESFEAFSNVKSCPICRSIYNRAPFPEGDGCCLNMVAVRIQRIARGFLDRLHLVQVKGHMINLNQHRSLWALKRVRSLYRIGEYRVKENGLSEVRMRQMEFETITVSREIMDCDTRLAQIARNREVALGASDVQRIVTLSTKSASTCPICQCLIRGNNRLIVTSCKHVYHAACIGSWEDHLKNVEQTPYCPVCRSAYATFICDL